MVERDEGLTSTYNRFHDPNESDPRIARLRELHAAMDRVVLDAYGWTDIRPTYEFLLDFEDDEDGNGAGSRRRKPTGIAGPTKFATSTGAAAGAECRKGGGTGTPASGPPPRRASAWQEGR